MLGWEKLTTPKTEDEVMAEFLLPTLQRLGFPVTSWQNGDPTLTELRAFATAYAYMTQMLAEYTVNRHNETASGDYLKRISRSEFDNTPKESVATRRLINCTLAAGEASFTPGIGELVVAWNADTSLTYRSVESKQITAGATVSILCECEIPGEIGNSPSIGEITELVTTYAGLTCVDTATSVSGTEEEDPDVLRNRNKSKWATLSLENTVEAISNVVTTAVTGVTFVKIDDTNPRGAGTVDIHCSGSAAVSGTDDVLAAQAAARARYFNPDPRIQAFAATAQTFNPTGAVLCDPSIGITQTRANVEAALLALVRSSPIGGRSYTNGSSHVLLFSDYIDAVKDAAGVVGFTTAMTGNIAIGTFSKLVPPSAWALTYATTLVT